MLKKILLPALLAFPLINAGTLTISSSISEAAAKKLFQEVVDTFESQHPDIQVVVNTTDHEAFKTQIRSLLTLPKGQAPDIITWFASERMRFFARKGLLQSIDNFWNTHDMDNQYPEAISQALKLNGVPYGITLSGYTWGLYYRKDILEKVGIQPPQTFDQLLQACRSLRKANYIPIALGSKYQWPIAGQFDILNMRAHGFDFHQQFTQGKIPFTDPRIKETLQHLQAMSENACFNKNHGALPWTGAAALMNSEAEEPNRSAMIYMGMFLDFALSEKTKPLLGLARFPKIKYDMPNYEDIPTDVTYIIPKNSSNSKDAETFLKFLIQPEIAAKLSAWQLPLIKGAKASQAPLIQQAQELLDGTEKSAEFLDRDMNPEMASHVMEGLSKFLAKPDQRDSILDRLEKTRQRIYK